LIPVIISILALSILIAYGTLVSYRQPEIRTAIRIPAVLLPLKTFSAAEPVMATGIKTIPATTAHGTLTITNGSVIAQELPKGLLLFTGSSGIEVITETVVFVPAGSAAGYGVASVPAHTTISGKAGNIPAMDVDSVEGSSLYIRNLQPFTGGQDAYSVRIITPQDRQAALDSTRASLASQEARIRAILMQPCKETASGEDALLSVLWACRFAATPHVPGLHITGVKIDGNTLLVEGVFVVRPRPFTGK
ncbi:MAG: hypothetical protein ACREP9_07875, partial [Candidatus Dormibacteraceae bacterium]